MTDFQVERDSIVFLGLLAIANERFDIQYRHADGEKTHVKGLNIFACIVDNIDGQVLTVEQNQIHAAVDPMQHAEQRALREGMATIKGKRPFDLNATSVESWYRGQLFNDPDSNDPLNAGSTIYTTLEPCPFCTSALLVTRMKRIVYLIPDPKFGGTYSYLKTSRYEKYDMSYGQLDIRMMVGGIDKAVGLYGDMLKRVAEMKATDPKIYDTLLLDGMKDLVEKAASLFSTLSPSDLVTAGSDRIKNERTLKDLQVRCS